MLPLLNSLDGGGEHGAYTVRLIRRINDATGYLSWPETFFGGTSIGGVIGLALASGASINEIEHTLVNKSRYIFRKRFLGGILWAKYGDQRKNVFKTLIPVNAINSLKRPCYVTAFSTYSNKSVVLHQHIGALDAAMATSAAPTFFPSYQGLIDGGVVQNNPSGIVADLIGKKLTILSIGTGYATDTYYSHGPLAHAGDWGVVQWMWRGRIIQTLLDAECSMPLPRNVHTYCRVNGVRPRTPMDDLKAIPGLLDAADRTDIRPAVRFLEEMRRH